MSRLLSTLFKYTLGFLLAVLISLLIAWTFRNPILAFWFSNDLERVWHHWGLKASVASVEIKDLWHLELHQVHLEDLESHQQWMNIDAMEWTLDHPFYTGIQGQHIRQIRVSHMHVDLRKPLVLSLWEKVQALKHSPLQTKPQVSSWRTWIHPLPVIHIDQVTVTFFGFHLLPFRQVKFSNLVIESHRDGSGYGLEAQMHIPWLERNWPKGPYALDMRGHGLNDLVLQVQSPRKNAFFDFQKAKLSFETWIWNAQKGILIREMHASSGMQSIEIGTLRCQHDQNVDLPQQLWHLKQCTFEHWKAELELSQLQSLLPLIQSNSTSSKSCSSPREKKPHFSVHFPKTWHSNDGSMVLKNQGQTLTWEEINGLLEWGKKINTQVELTWKDSQNNAHLSWVASLALNPLKLKIDLEIQDFQWKLLQHFVPLPRISKWMPISHIQWSTEREPLHLEISLKDGSFESDGHLKINGLVFKHPRLSPYSIGPMDIHLYYHLSRDALNDRWDLKALEIKRKGAHLNMDLAIEPVPPQKSKQRAWQFDALLEIPLQDAQQLFESMPHALTYALDGLQTTGQIGYVLKVKGRTDQITKVDLQSDLLYREFNIVQWPSQAYLPGLNRGFKLKVKDPNAIAEHWIAIPPSIYPIEEWGERQRKKFGLVGSGNYKPKFSQKALEKHYRHWVFYNQISPWMVQLITTTEDRGFFKHRGFSTYQILHSLEANLKEGNFKRGASTISMQLIKNAFLGRDKTLSRKWQEVLLTSWMENLLRIPKVRLLEVYFNIIEFGPEIYGIQEGALHYFGKQPLDLTLVESAYLVAILPGPRKFHFMWERGKAGPKTLKRMQFYMNKMYERHCLKTTTIPTPIRCPDRETFERLKAQPLDFYKPEPEDPPYRPDLYDENGHRRFQDPDLYPEVYGWGWMPTP